MKSMNLLKVDNDEYNYQRNFLCSGRVEKIRKSRKHVKKYDEKVISYFYFLDSAGNKVCYRKKANAKKNAFGRKVKRARFKDDERLKG